MTAALAGKAGKGSLSETALAFTSEVTAADSTGFYAKDDFGVVYIRFMVTMKSGLIYSRGLVTIANLPAGYRPRSNIRAVTESRSSTTGIESAFVLAYTSGLLQVCAASSTTASTSTLVSGFLVYPA